MPPRDIAVSVHNPGPWQALTDLFGRAGPGILAAAPDGDDVWADAVLLRAHALAGAGLAEVSRLSAERPVVRYQP